MLPESWRSDVVEMIRGGRPIEAAWFTGNPLLTPEERLGIYQEQYRLRLLEALRDEASGLRALVGEGADELLWGFISERPSTHWTLSRVTRGLPEWLESTGAPAAQVDMAALDLAVSHAFAAADGPGLDPSTLAAHTRLRLAAHVALLWLSTDVHRVRSEALAGGEPEPPGPADVPLVVFRVDDGVRHRVLHPTAWRILDSLGEGRTLAAALDAAVAAGADPDELAVHVGEWFQVFASRGLVESVPEFSGVD